MIANSLSKLNEPFYISTSADWRGRIYTNSFYISYPYLMPYFIFIKVKN